MVRIRWYSTGQACARSLLFEPPIDGAALETLFEQWQAALNQWDFMASLPLDQAAAVCRVILDRVPPGTPTKHALLHAQRKKEKEKRDAAKKRQATKKKRS
jgi:hypothetical protein